MSRTVTIKLFTMKKKCLSGNEKSSHNLGKKHISDKKLVSRIQKELLKMCRWKTVP